MIRVVADPNIFISALMYKGLPGTFLDLALAGGFTLILSAAILDELDEKLRGKFELSAEQAQPILSRLESTAHMVRPGAFPAVIRDDPDDDVVLACAVTGRADYLVSGDRHLLRLQSYEGISIVTVRQFMDTSRKPIPKTEAQDRKGRRADFDLPLPEDRSAIQQSIGEVLCRIAGHDARRAGLLLYGLQIASLNLPRQATPSEPEEPAEMVEEIVHDPTHGPLALESELPENKEPLSTLDLLLREFADDTPCAFTEVRT